MRLFYRYRNEFARRDQSVAATANSTNTVSMVNTSGPRLAGGRRYRSAVPTAVHVSSRNIGATRAHRATAAATIAVETMIQTHTTESGIAFCAPIVSHANAA